MSLSLWVVGCVLCVVVVLVVVVVEEGEEGGERRRGEGGYWVLDISDGQRATNLWSGSEVSFDGHLCS